MSNFSKLSTDVRAFQQATQDSCFHPTGTFIEFKKAEIEQSIPERFEKIVGKFPNRPAVITRSEQLTYDDLNKSANRIAHAILEQRGEGTESVALLLEPGANVIAAILGVLKAGKYYVPLNRSYPRAKISSMLEASQAGLVLISNQSLSLVSEVTQGARQVVNIDVLDNSFCAEENIGLTFSQDSLAFILYTSGSSGEPKGVVHNHSNVLHDIMNYANGLHICADDRLSLLRPISVIGAVRQIFGALLNGAALFPINLQEEGVGSVAQWLIQQEITIYRSVPTIFRHFVGTLTGEEVFPKLRVIFLTGETITKADVELYKKYFSPECILVSALGSTETLDFRWYFIGKESQVPTSTVPVGYALEDMEALLLDDDHKEVGYGRTGEIVVRSRYLSLGYWQKPDLTQAAFMTDPQGGEERIYKTGDLGRMSPDGCMVHLGRKDLQLKIRGYTIQPAEVESSLLNLNNIEEAVVMMREDKPHDQRLVAYLVPSRHPAPLVSVLRRNLAEALPEYMIPSAFVMLDALPTAPSGKVAHEALPAPGSTHPELETPFVAPRTPAEEMLTEIWSDVLGLDQVGINDNFLELGGHSLLATQVVSQVIKTFRVELSSRTLFESPTVADMAVVITQGQANEADEEDVDRMLADLESLSDEQARQIIARESSDN